MTLQYLPYLWVHAAYFHQDDDIGPFERRF